MQSCNQSNNDQSRENNEQLENLQRQVSGIQNQTNILQQGTCWFIVKSIKIKFYRILVFNSWDSQIRHSIAKCSPPLHRFFCVRAGARGGTGGPAPQLVYLAQTLLKTAAFVLNFKLCPPPDKRLAPLIRLLCRGSVRSCVGQVKKRVDGPHLPLHASA